MKRTLKKLERLSRSIFLVLLITTNMPGIRAEPQIPEVDAARIVRLASADLLSEYHGTTASRTDIWISSERAGVVESIVDIGDQVSSNAQLVKLKDDEEAAQHNLALAEILYTTRLADVDQRKFDRARKLAADQLVSSEALEDLQAQSALSKLSIKMARIKAGLTALAQERTTLLAPVSGQIVERMVNVGEYVDVGQPILRLVSFEHLEAVFKMPIALSNRLVPRMKLTLSDPEREFMVSASVRTVLRVAEHGSNSFEIRADIEEATWSVGVPVVAHLDAASLLSFSLPTGSIQGSGSDSYVLRIESDSTVSQIPVVVTDRIGQIAMVHGSLEVGDMVVRGAHPTLHDGQKVTVTNLPHMVVAGAKLN